MALPNAVTYSREIRDSSDAISQEKPLVISDKIWLNDPNETQFLSWVLQQDVIESTENHVFGHLEDAPFPMWVTYTGSTETSSQQTDNISIEGVMARCAAGSRLYNPATGEVMRLTLDPDSANETQTVARNFGRGVSTDYLTQGQPLMILTPAMYEGFTVGKGMTNARVFKAFCTGIIDYPVKITGTENAEKARGGNPFEVALNKSWTLAKKQMEAELIFGAEEQDSSTYTYNMHATGGLYDFIQTNVWTVDAVMTRFDLHDIIGEWRLFNKKAGAIICSGAFKDMVVEWAYGKVQYNQGTKVDGIDIQQVLIHGTHYDLIECDLFNQEPVLMGTVLLVPYGKYSYRPLIHYEDRDLAYLPINEDEKDQNQGHIKGEYGWEFFEEETFGMITGLEF